MANDNAWADRCPRCLTTRFGPSARPKGTGTSSAAFCHGVAFLDCHKAICLGMRFFDGENGRQGGSKVVHAFACAASLMLLLAACSTAEQVEDQAGFVPSASTEKSAEPPIVTASDLNQQKAAPDPVASQSSARADANSTQPEFELSASQVKALIAQSRAEFSGECPCPYDVDKSGRSCGKRSAYSSAAASTVLCYPKDVLPQ
jgi:hypothetical protein